MLAAHIIIFIIILLIILILYFIEPILSKQKLKNNNEHGSARWATVKEIKKNFRKEKVDNIQESGFPVYFSKNNKIVWFDMNTPHYIFLGSTGSGKSATAVIPECSFIATAKKKKSVFITDPKGEIFSTTSQMFQDEGYKVLTLDFRNPSLSNHLNILEPIIKEYEEFTNNEKLVKLSDNENDKMKYQNNAIEHLAECNQLINSVSTMIMADNTAKEAFWNNSASDLLYGLIALFLEDYADGKIKREQITLSSIKKFQNSSMANKNLKVLIRYVERKPYGLKSKDKLIPIITTSENTYKSITSIFNERMTLFDDINVENITSTSDFDFDILGKTPTVLYCCVPDETKIYYSLISIIVSLIYKRLVLLCNNETSKRLPCELVFLLDEFANTPPLSDIETMVSVARSRGMNFQFFLQSFAQLDNLYGKEVSQIIQDNCGLAYLKTNTQETAEAISKRLGNKTIETNSLNYSMNFFNSSGSKGTNLIARNLMTADEVKQLHYKTIIFPTIGYPILRNTVVYGEFSCYRKGMIERNSRPLKRLVNTYFTVEQLFQKESVEEPDEENKLDTIESKNKTRLVNIINNILKHFGKIDFDVEYVKESDEDIRAELFLAPPLSLADLKQLEDLSSNLSFTYEAVSSKEKVNKKNRNSKIIIILNEMISDKNM